MTPYTVQIVIYLIVAAGVVALTAAIGAYFNRVMIVQKDAARRVPVTISVHIKKIRARKIAEMIAN